MRKKSTSSAQGNQVVIKLANYLTPTLTFPLNPDWFNDGIGKQWLTIIPIYLGSIIRYTSNIDKNKTKTKFNSKIIGMHTSLPQRQELLALKIPTIIPGIIIKLFFCIAHLKKECFT